VKPTVPDRSKMRGKKENHKGHKGHKENQQLGFFFVAFVIHLFASLKRDQAPEEFG
jgi:hypothetical protein